MYYRENFDLSHGDEDRAWEIGVVAFGTDLNIAEAEDQNRLEYYFRRTE